MNKLILSLGNIFDIDSINQQINLTLEAAIVVTLVSLGLGVFLSLIYLHNSYFSPFINIIWC